MKKSLKILAFILAVSLLSGVLCGCSGETQKVQTGSEFTYWVAMGSASSQTITSYNEMLMYQEMEKATGTKVKFIHPASGSTGTEAFQILLSSGDYPDMMEYSWGSYTGGADQAINDGVIISLNDYLKDHAPNYYSYMEGEKGAEKNYIYKAQSVSYGGNYYGFKNMNIGNYRSFGGLYVRKDMLDKWGLDVPETIDEWENILKTAKENGCKAPLTGTKTLFGITGVEMFNTAWNVGKDWYIEGDKVKFGPFQPEYKEYIAKMTDWMKKGYIDSDYITNASNNVLGYMTNGSSVAAYGNIGSGIGKLLPAMEEKDPNYTVAACPYPVLKKGEKAFLQDLQPESNDPVIAISVQCGIDNEERYKEAISWCDYLYSDEGIILKSFGLEGETYTVETDENGEKHYVYTDKIMDHEKIGAHSVEAALWHFFRPSNSPGFNQHPDYLSGFYPYEEQKEAVVIWNSNYDEAVKHMYPPVSYTGEEAAEKANIEAKGRDNLDAGISNIILGKQSIDTFDDVIKQAKKDGYADLLKIQQDAYNRYLEVIKNAQ